MEMINSLQGLTSFALSANTVGVFVFALAGLLLLAFLAYPKGGRSWH